MKDQERLWDGEALTESIDTITGFVLARAIVKEESV
jgi:hypothetical protein